jgi:hypothetical protein
VNCEAGSLGESRRAVNAGEVLAIALLAKMLGGIEGGILAVCMGDVCMRVVTIEIEEIVWTRWWCGMVWMRCKNALLIPRFLRAGEWPRLALLVDPIGSRSSLARLRLLVSAGVVVEHLGARLLPTTGLFTLWEDLHTSF